MLHTPRMPVCGGLTMGVKVVMPKEPRLEMVKDAPCSFSGAMVPAWHSLTSSFMVRLISAKLISSAWRMVGTSSPRSVSTATPRLACLNTFISSSL